MTWKGLRLTFVQRIWHPSRTAMMVAALRTLVLTTVTAILLTLVASLAPATIVRAAGPFTVTKTADTNDGVCDTDCSLREAIGAANAAGGASTINVPAGTYSLSLGELQTGNTAGTNITLSGAGSATTIIDQSDGVSRLFNVDYAFHGNVTLTIQNMTLQNGVGGAGGGGGAILDGDTGDVLNITNVVFNNNRTSSFNGGAISFTGGGSLNVQNSTFTNNSSPTGNGGAIHFLQTQAGSFQISNTTFSGNSATGGTLGGQGGAINVGCNICSPFSISNSTFTNNTAVQVGASGGQGGAIMVGSGTLTFQYNRITGNHAAGSGTGIYHGGSDSVTATNNWWGCNSGPGGAGCDTAVNAAGSMTTSPYIVLSNTASPGTINVGQSTTLTASFLQNSNNQALTTGQISTLIGLPVTWGSAVHGSLSGQQTTIQSNGQATATLTQDNTCNNSSANATVDNGTATANVTVQCADLMATKSNDVSGVTTLGDSWTWTIHIANGGSGFAAFANGNTILTDNLPNSNITYGSASVVNASGLTGTVNCSLSSSDLSCTASGPVQLNAGGSFDVQFTATPGAIGAFANPRSGGSCSIDPNGDVAESNEGNNACSNSVTVNDIPVSGLTAANSSPTVLGNPTAFTATITNGTNATYQWNFGDGATGSGNPLTYTYPVAGIYTAIVTASNSANVVTATTLVTITNVPDVSITKTHTGNFTKGQVGATYTLHVSNVGGLPTSGTVTVTDALPAGLTATALSGAGWSCNVGALTCTRNDVLNVSASYPDITLTVDVAVNASSAVTNTATVSGGGEANTANDTADDPTTIDKANTTTTLISGPNPSVFGESVTFTATVTSGVGTPTGNVTFFDNGAAIGSGALDVNGVATLSTTSLSVGTHPITATYTGDANFNVSTSSQVDQVVDQANTTTTLASSSNPSVFGQAVTFTATVTASAPGSGTPTGNVTFYDNGASIGTGALSGGVATLSTASLSVGTHPITATYTGDTNFTANTSNQIDQVVDQANTSTALASNPNPSVFGQAVTFTATVTANAPGSGAPTGNVTFFDNGVSVGIGALSGGVATLSTTSLSVGTHPITATYTGDADFTASTSNQVNQVVDQANTTTALASNLNPSVFGQSVTFTATVSVVTPGSGTPTGNVTFFDNGVSIGTGALSGGVATLSTASLSVGTHPITATYTGDTNFTANTSNQIDQVVDQANTSTALASNPNPSVFGQAVTFTATVTANAPGSGTPTGNVTFFDNGISIGTGALSGGVATLSTTSLSVGTHPITATYTGDTNFTASTSNQIDQVVDQADTMTTIASDPNPSLPGQTVFFTATVSAAAPGAGTPTGNVTVYDNGASLGTFVLSGSAATFNINTLAVGQHPITATYSGNASFNASMSTIYTQTVNAADTGTTLASDPNPSVFGQSVTFTATVTATFGTATGNVTFFDNGASLGTSALDANGVATLSTASLSVGTHPITATYNGNTNFNASLSNEVDQVVDRADTTTSLASDPNPSVFGQSVTFTATVTANAPGNGTPTGNVVFLDNGVSIGAGTLDVNGVATLNTSSLAVGTHPITATYSGDANFNSSTSSTLNQVVDRADTATSLASDPNPSVFGQSATFTSTVTTNAPGSGTPMGSVTFFDNGASIGAGTLDVNGVAAFSTSSLAVGTHPITSTYNGDGSFSASTSPTVNQVVDKANTATALTSAPNPSGPGQPAIFTATVTANLPGAGTPSGIVTFTIDSSTIAQPLDGNGVAIYLTDTLALGTHPVSAAYSGDANFNPSGATLSGGQVVTDTPITNLVVINSSPTTLGHVTTFTATASGTNIAFTWDFGDGGTNSGSTVNHVYATTGFYTAHVTATNGVGQVVATTPVTVTNLPPIPDAGPNQNVLISALVSLDSSGSIDPDGHLPLSYGWTQTGGPSVILSNDTISRPTFTAPAFQTILTFTLAVTDARGLPNTAPASVTIFVGDRTIAGLTAANSSPNVVGQTTALTATITDGTNVTYQWDFGDGSPAQAGNPISHTYPMAGNFTATVTATNGAGSVAATTLVVIDRTQVYLPSVLRDYADAPDLIVDRIIVSSQAVTVVIKNIGPAPAENAFWVDTYIAPNPPPTAVNQIWYDGRSEQGLVWGVTDPVLSGQAVTLTIGGPYYVAAYSRFLGGLPAGTPIYAQVDSYDAATTYGAVLETHEILGLPYNNIFGPLSTLLRLLGIEPGLLPRTSAIGSTPSPAGHTLPPRPAR